MPGNCMSARIKVGMITAQQLQRFFGAGGGHYLVTLVDQQDARQLQVYGRVIDDEDRLSGHSISVF